MQEYQKMKAKRGLRKLRWSVKCLNSTDHVWRIYSDPDLLSWPDGSLLTELQWFKTRWKNPHRLLLTQIKVSRWERYSLVKTSVLEIWHKFTGSEENIFTKHFPLCYFVSTIYLGHICTHVVPQPKKRCCLFSSFWSSNLKESICDDEDSPLAPELVQLQSQPQQPILAAATVRRGRTADQHQLVAPGALFNPARQSLLVVAVTDPDWCSQRTNRILGIRDEVSR